MSWLFKSYPIEWQDARDGDDSYGSDPTSSLTASLKDTEEVEETPFVGGPRPPRDVAWAWLLGCSCVAATIWCCVMQSYRNANFDALISDKTIRDPASCPLDAATPGRRLLQIASLDEIYLPEATIFRHPGWLILWLLATLAACAILSTMLLRLFEAKSQATVKAIAMLQVGVPIAVCAVLFGTGQDGGITLFLFAVAGGVCACIWRQRLVVLARLISVACSAIADNPNLFWYSLLCQACASWYLIPIMYALSNALQTGSLVPNLLADRTVAGCLHKVTQQPVPCCTWQPSAWAIMALLPPYLVMVWVKSFIMEALTFVVSGTVCQWYFAPVSSTSCRGSAARSLRHAGASAGTLALAGLVLPWVKFVRIFTYVNDRRLTLRNPIAWCCGILAIPYCCIPCCVTPCVEHITKYSTHRAAISGNGFFHASSLMFNTLRRNHMNAIGMGWVPPLILRMASSVLALSVGYAIAPSSSSSLNPGQILLRRETILITLLLCFEMAGFLLLAVVDSLYVCFTLDRDRQQCTKNEVHDIFTSMPTIGPIWDDEPGSLNGVALGVPATAAVVRDEAVAGSGDQQPPHAAPPQQSVQQHAAV